MAKRMLIDTTHPEETRVVVVNGTKLEEFDVETSTKRQLKGNIYLAKVIRVEPSLQAAFVDYGGGRHGFLAFNEIHPDYYQIPPADRQRMQEEQRREVRYDNAPKPEDTIAEATETQPEETALLVPESEPSENSPEVKADQENGEATEFQEKQSENEDAADNSDGSIETVETNTVVETIGGEESTDADDENENDNERPRRRSWRHYKIQDVIKQRQILLIQVVKEERGNKGAALTTYISLAGRYCVLMPNAGRGGGVSRKITDVNDRRRLKGVLNELDLPEVMGLIVRTAGAGRSKPEIKRDCEYLLRTWDSVRDLTLRSVAPALVYEEASLIKRVIRDMSMQDIDEILVEGDEGYRMAKDFMRMLSPSYAKKVQHYKDAVIPLFHRFQVENQLDAMNTPMVGLRSGGSIVINPTEALVAIDVNSGRATRERHIEETALKTNLEAAEEIARQLRLRDLAGLIVIDFIDMEDTRNNNAVERRLKEALKHDRARIQVGKISPFGLLEMSRQRLRPSLVEFTFQPCRHCHGTGHVRSVESTAMHILRSIEEEGIKRRSAEIIVSIAPNVALYILNQKRAALNEMELRHNLRIIINADDSLVPPEFRMEKTKLSRKPEEEQFRPVSIETISNTEPEVAVVAEPEAEDSDDNEAEETSNSEDSENGNSQGRNNKRRRRRRPRRGGRGDRPQTQEQAGEEVDSGEEAADIASISEAPADESLSEPEAALPSEPAPPEAETSEKHVRKPRARKSKVSASEEVPASGVTEVTEEAPKPKRRKATPKASETSEETPKPKRRKIKTPESESQLSESQLSESQLSESQPQPEPIPEPQFPPQPKRSGWWRK